MRATVSGTTTLLENGAKRRNSLSREAEAGAEAKAEAEAEADEAHLEDHLRALLLVLLFLLLSRGLLRLLLLPPIRAIVQAERNGRTHYLIERVLQARAIV